MLLRQAEGQSTAQWEGTMLAGLPVPHEDLPLLRVFRKAGKG